MKKLYLKLLTCLGLLVSTPVLAEDSPIEFSANVGYFSDYIYRGGSQTADGAAIQGGFDMSHESGFYIGTWASNVDFGNSANIEIDFYGGVGGDLPNGVSWDVGALYYWYPGVKDSDDSGGDFDFVDIGELMPETRVVPLIIKSLLFTSPGQELDYFMTIITSTILWHFWEAFLGILGIFK